MSTKKWGPPVWTLLHTLAEKINPDKFAELAPQLFVFIKRICSALPCPDCAQHASQFLARINFSGIKNKTDLKNMLYIFHNVVNTRLKKPLYNVSNLSVYANNNIIQVFNNFAEVYHTKGNMALLADSFQRKLIMVDFKKWLVINIGSFLFT